MEKIQENTLQQYPFDYFKSHPELIIEALAQGHDLSLMLKREGNQVFVYSPRRYSEQVNDILDSAKLEYQRKKSEGYSREQALHDFMQAQQEMSQYLP